ncbi:MAG TPA: MaoC family dehydratase [Dehalococcoidia bacterium]|nr:MaoC family dehydratase [Dehalococcoidia bacterium]
MTGQPRYFDDIDFGDELEPVEREIKTDQVVRFVNVWRTGGGGGDGRFTDPERAKQMGLPGPIVPGAMIMGLFGQMLVEWAPNVTINKLDVVFRGNLLHNTPYKMAGIIVEKDERDGQNVLECDVYVENEKQERPVTGKATLSLPSRE